MEETKNNIKTENGSAVKTENAPAVKAENTPAVKAENAPAIKAENAPAAKSETTPVVKRNYKDSVFRMLFSDKASLLSLFNALTGSHYENPDELEIVTLDNVIYMSYKNDQACMLDMQMHLYEHQSSVNPNMPLRYLPYITDTYERLIVNENIYGKKRIRLPEPQFVVFYNGTEPQPERKILRLSDSFGPEEKKKADSDNKDDASADDKKNSTTDNDTADSAINNSTTDKSTADSAVDNVSTDAATEKPVIDRSDIKLELKVLQLNINPGYNESIKKECRLLMEYCQYVSKVREYSRTIELRDAVERAVTECIQEGILEDFLKKNRAEVIHMSIYEFDEEKYHKALRQESWEEGREFGRKEIAFRLFDKNRPLEDISDTLGISMDYTMELHQQYEHMVQEESNYGNK